MRIVANAKSRRVRLRDCPPGLFLFADSRLGFKSEYTSNENARAGEGGDAYVVASGEYFWGGATTKAERGALMVTPVHCPIVLAPDMPLKRTEPA
jgi:hypothetical protein